MGPGTESDGASVSTRHLGPRNPYRNEENSYRNAQNPYRHMDRPSARNDAMEQLLRGILSGSYRTPTIPAPTCTAHELTGASSPVELDTEPAGVFEPATVNRQGRIDLSKVTAYDVTGKERQGRIDLSKITTYDVPAKNDRRVRPCHVPGGSIPHAR
jgi:hypothetical protein